jgi:LDH2 family malate/lactate/ureidoglycolate dehydrogenase
MKIKIPEARELAVGALMSLRYSRQDAETIADHLIDAALRGVTFGSLARILAISEKMKEVSDNRQPVTTLRETPTSAVIDGGDNVGYVVAHHATRLAIDKAKRNGMAMVAARNTFYTGLFSYYMEMATREGLVAMAIGNGPAHVAPEGAAEGRLGTNPIAFGFPSDHGDPVIWDIGTCAIMHGELLLHRRTGEPLPEGVALDSNGQPTRDPVAALAGAIKTWGGHRGSGLSVVVQMLGALCGGPVISPGTVDMAYFVIVIDPKIFLPEGEYPARVNELADEICSARPIDPQNPVRMPFARSAQLRRQNLQSGDIEVPDVVHAGLVKMLNS